MMGPSELMTCSACCCAAAICCHCALWWKPALFTLAMREDGVRSALVALKEDARRALEEMAAVETLRDNVAGHLRNAPNMVRVL